MNASRIIIVAGLFCFGVFAVSAEVEKPDAGPPLANDLGPKKLDVTSYPPEIQKGYQVMMTACAKCHNPHRAFNAQFVQPEGKTEAQNAAIAKLKESNPELFSDKNVWKIEANIWKRFVRRMMAKPGAEISKEDAKQIYKFLVFDSNARKLKKQKQWTTDRKKMLAEFKEKDPENYKKHYLD